MESMIDNTIFADFNNFDPDGCIRLNCIGTVRDLETAGISLHADLHLIVSDGDLRAEIAVLPPSAEGIWRGKIVTVVEEFDHKNGMWSPL
jgi:hypothetical protein